MDPERWTHVDKLPQSALEVPGAERDQTDSDPLIGRTFTHYCIVSRLGGGGMGVVYRAEDTRLRRPVALKFISDDLSGEPEALSRFAREAEAASALNHPNICTVHDIGEQDGRAFMVMEYLEGSTLKDRLVAGPLSLDAVLDVGIQIAAALDVAHTAGIVHRDIKPANIFIGSRDHVKVLDFGLAKMRGTAGHHADVTTIAGTRQGIVMGTAAYMALEQARGEVVDHRADIWSFGLVLYEMAKGTRPPQAVRLRVESSPELERIVSKCLETDRDLRYQHASELGTDLDRLKRGSGSALTARDEPRAKGRARWLVGAAVAAIALAAAAYFVYPRQASALTDKDTIVLADFTNTTGDSVFDDTLRQGLAVQLQQSPFLSLVSDDRMRRTLALMEQPPDVRLTSEIARDVCVRTASVAVVAGSIASLGSQFVLGLRATNCTTGDALANEQVQAARKEDVLDALSKIALRFRTRVGESLSTIEKHSMPLEEGTTSSLAAWQAYSAGMRAMRTSGQRTARPLFERAVAIDPEFAVAQARLGFSYSGLGETQLARQHISKAYELRHRASDLERFFIDMVYDRDVTGNLEREQRTLELWAQTYPRDPNPHGLLSGFVTGSTGKYQMSIDEASKAIGFNPDAAAAYERKAYGELHLHRLSDAEATLRETAERKFENESLRPLPYLVAFLRDDGDAMARTVAAASSRPGVEDTMSHLEALRLARAGRLQDARRSAAIAIDIAQRSGQRERAALFEVATAVWEAFYGNAATARQTATRALALARGRDVDYAAAFALAMSGDAARARTIVTEIEKNLPEDTSAQYLYLPALRARLALEARDPAAAIESLKSASRFDLAFGGIGFYGFFGKLYPLYVRGLAYLDAKQPAAAVGEFQRILDHRSIVLVDPMDAMARLQLARAHTLSGDTVKAKSAYDDLFTLWKSADPDIPVLKEARAEYARLP